MVGQHWFRGVFVVLIATTTSTTITAPVHRLHWAQTPAHAQTLVAQQNALSIQDASQMAPINQALKQGYEGQSAEKIELQAGDSEAGIEAVLAGQVELAAISRPLTNAEKAKGLVQQPITREKIAIATHIDNPFQLSLTVEQVNQIFQGDITNWSELGGADRPLKVIQRPEASNAAQAIQRYGSIQPLPAATGETADTPEALVTALGEDGIGFALVSELVDQPSLRALPMYGILPDDDNYPFSQPFTYVYRAENEEAVQAFLGFVESDAGQTAIATAITKPQGFTPIPLAQGQPAAETDPFQDSGLNWFTIVLVALLFGGLGWLAFKTQRKRRQAANTPRPAPNYAERIKPSHLTANELGTRDRPDNHEPVPDNKSEKPATDPNTDNLTNH